VTTLSFSSGVLSASYISEGPVFLSSLHAFSYNLAAGHRLIWIIKA